MIRPFNKHLPAIMMLALSVAAIDLNAQDLAKEQKALTDTQAKITALHSEQTATAKQLAQLKAERASIEKSIEPATQEFNAVKADRDKTVADAKANPSDTTQKLADNANFKFMLAERKYNKAKEALDEHDAKTSALEKRIASNEAAIKASQNAVEQQKAGLEQLQKQSADKAKLAATAAAAAAAQKKELELKQNKAALAETQAKAKAAQAEVDNLKKVLAEKQTQEAAAKAAAPVAAAAAIVATPAAVASTPTQSPAVAAPAKTKPTTTAKPAQDFKTIHAAFAQREAAVSKRSIRGNLSKIVYIKAISGGKEVSKTALSLPPLTPDLFQGVAPLPAGDFDIVLGLQTWKQTVSAADGGKKFIVNIDTKSGKPELVMYPEDATK